MSDSVLLLLKELRLPGFARHYKTLWQTATESSWSHADYLLALCEYEMADRHQRRIQKWRRESQLTTTKTFATLDRKPFSGQNQRTIAKLEQDLEWARRSDNVLLIGPSGTGKTHLASALGHTHRTRYSL